MIGHPQNLAAWLDDELPREEASAVTEHVESCPECRRRAGAYSEVSRALVDLRPPRRRRPFAAAWIGAAAAAVLLAVALWPRHPAPAFITDVRPTPRVRQVAPAPVPPLQPLSAPAPRLRHRRVAPTPRPQAKPEPRPVYNGPVIRVALPADALFAPGAVPPGVEIYADLTLAADGSPRELRLVP